MICWNFGRPDENGQAEQIKTDDGCCDSRSRS
jgi:hypothetical protein